VIVRVWLALIHTPGNRSLFKSVTSNTVKEVKVEWWENFENIRIDPSGDFVADNIEFEAGVNYTLDFEDWFHRQNVRFVT